jgi:hypothetical protein
MEFGVITMGQMAKVVSTVVFVLITIAVSRYLYLLTYRNSEGISQAGNHALFLTAGALVITCIAGGLMFYSFLRHDRDKSPKTIPLRQLTLAVDVIKSTTPVPFDIARWEQLNPWLTEGQADDRMPMLGSAGNGNGSSSVRRSTARRTHQMMYKKWSQARHD